MKFKTSSIKLITFSLLFAVSTAAHAFSTFADPYLGNPGYGTAWDPGDNTARISPIGVAPTLGSGGATWSIIGAGVSSALELDQFGDPAHGSGSAATTTSLAALNPSLNIPGIINDALDLWASVSGFTNLGQVADSGLGLEASEAGAGSFGDIRIGAIAFDGAGGVLAHGYQPGTEAIFSNGSIGGDIHIDNAENWIDGFDLAYVLLHEIGHALGLGHSDVTGSVLEPSYPSGGGVPAFALSADDIAGIQSIYGPAAVVPLPAAPLLFLSAMGLIGFARRKRKTVTS